MRTGPDFHEAQLLSDGTAVALRHIRPDDAAELARGFARLSATSRYHRFFGGVTSLSDETLRYLTNVDGHDHVAIIAAMPDPDGGPERGLGVARFIRLPGQPTVAEAAITVVDDFQGRGLGRLLALTLARAARERGISHFRGEILADNPTVRQLLIELGATLHDAGDGRVLFDVALDSPATDDAGLEAKARQLLRAGREYLVGVLQRLHASR
jgi:GNAT superfamily N-acetyltransferase